MSSYTLRSGATAMPEATLLQMLTELVTVSGVSDLSSSDNFQVTERASGGPNMSVDIAAGRAFIRKSTSETYPVRSTATENVVIGANSSGNPRIDAIVVYVDLAESANSDASDVVKYAAVAGTPAASPSAPDDSAIASGVGVSNPFLRLADVEVINGASTIPDAKITDRRRRFKTRTSIHQGTASDASTTTYDVSVNNYIQHTLGGNRTLAVIGDSVNDMFMIELIQPSSGGPYTPTWWSNIEWGSEGVPDTTILGASESMIIAFIKLEDGKYRGFVVGDGYDTT